MSFCLRFRHLTGGDGRGEEGEQLPCRPGPTGISSSVVDVTGADVRREYTTVLDQEADKVVPPGRPRRPCFRLSLTAAQLSGKPAVPGPENWLGHSPFCRWWASAHASTSATRKRPGCSRWVTCLASASRQISDEPPGRSRSPTRSAWSIALQVSPGAEGRDGVEESVGPRGEVLVQAGADAVVQDVQVQGPCVQVEAAVGCVGLVVEVHRCWPPWGWAALSPRRDGRYSHP